MLELGVQCDTLEALSPVMARGSHPGLQQAGVGVRRVGDTSFPCPGYEEVVWIPKGSIHIFIQDLNLSLSHLGEMEQRGGGLGVNLAGILTPTLARSPEGGPGVPAAGGDAQDPSAPPPVPGWDHLSAATWAKPDTESRSPGTHQCISHRHGNGGAGCRRTPAPLWGLQA